MFSSGCYEDLGRCFPSIFSLFFEFSQSFPPSIFTPMPVAECPSLFAASSFYSAILGFFEYHWFPLFVPLGTRTNVVSATLVAGSFLILHYFPLLRFSLQKTPADFLVLGGPKGLTFGLFLSKASRLHFLEPSFGYFSPLSFFPSGLILSCQVERSLVTFLHDSSSWVPWGTGPLLMSC